MFTKIIREKLLSIITNSKVLKKTLTFKEQLNLYSGVNKLEDAQLIKLYFRLNEELPPPIKTDPKAERILKIGLSLASLTVPLPGLSLAINYLVDINRYKCIIRSEKRDVPNKDLAFANCRYRASVWGVKLIQSEITKCEATKNPKKCRDKLFKLLTSQRQKMAKNEAKLKWSLAKAKQATR